MKYVIVGNGVASIGAIESIRKVDKEGEILVISNEDSPTYGRPLISYYLGDSISSSQLPLRPDSFYQENKVEMLLNTTVKKLDPAAKTLTTDQGVEIGYDKLLLAMGAAANRPPIPGLEGPDVYTFVKKDDAVHLMGAIRKGDKVVVIGAGLIGLKAAESLNARGVHVTLVEVFRLMGAYLDETAGNLIVNHLEEHGLRFLEFTPTKSILRDGLGRVIGVDTDKGVVECSAVVMAAGVRPNIALAQEAGLKVNRGVVVDECLTTSDPNIFAAGDVTEAVDLITGLPTVMPIWPNAYKQGTYAGVNMAGKRNVYPGALAMNSVSFYGLPTMSAGLVNAPDESGYETNVHFDEKNGVYRKLVFKDNRLVGYILLGAIDFAGFYTGFVRFKLELDEETKGHLLTGRPTPLDWPEELLQA